MKSVKRVQYDIFSKLIYNILLLLHNDYPLAPEKLAIPYDMLSDYCKKITDEYEIKVGNVKKFIPNLDKKTNYVIHYRNLQLYLSLGMKLTKVQTSKQWKRLKYTSTPTHITHKIFGKSYAAIHEIKPGLTFNKPISAGFTVLELSNWLMYDFHYRFIKKHFDAELLFTDTDSLTYEIKSEDVYEEFFKYKHLISVTIQRIQRFLMRLIKKLLAKWKTSLKEK